MDYFINSAWALERDRMVAHVGRRSQMGDSVNVHLLRELNDKFDQQMRDADTYQLQRMPLHNSALALQPPHPESPMQLETLSCFESESMSPPPLQAESANPFSFFLGDPVTPANIHTMSDYGTDSLTWNLDKKTARDLITKAPELLRGCTDAQKMCIRAVVEICKNRPMRATHVKYKMTFSKLRTLCNTLNRLGVEGFVSEVRHKH